MIEIGQMDYDLSDKMFEKHRSKIQECFCYNNIFNMTHYYKKEFANRDFLIAYGYMGYPKQVLIRHCYIITKDNQIIDTTSLIRKEQKLIDSSLYYTFAKLTIDEYIEAVLKLFAQGKEMQPDLKSSLTKQEREFCNYAIEHDLVVDNVSYDNYLKPFDTKNQLKNLSFLDVILKTNNILQGD